MIKKICPTCQEPIVAAHPLAVCEPCAEAEFEAVSLQQALALQEAEDEAMGAELFNRAERAAWHLSFNGAAA